MKRVNPTKLFDEVNIENRRFSRLRIVYATLVTAALLVCLEDEPQGSRNCTYPRPPSRVSRIFSSRFSICRASDDYAMEKHTGGRVCHPVWFPQYLDGFDFADRAIPHMSGTYIRNGGDGRTGVLDVRDQ